MSIWGWHLAHMEHHWCHLVCGFCCTFNGLFSNVFLMRNYWLYNKMDILRNKWKWDPEWGILLKQSSEFQEIERRTSLSCLALMVACTWTGESVTCVNFTLSGCCRYTFYEKEMKDINIIIELLYSVKKRVVRVQENFLFSMLTCLIVGKLTSLHCPTFLIASYSGVTVWGK